MLSPSLFVFFQYLLPAIVHIQHQPFLEHGDGPIVSTLENVLLLFLLSLLAQDYIDSRADLKALKLLPLP